MVTPNATAAKLAAATAAKALDSGGAIGATARSKVDMGAFLISLLKAELDFQKGKVALLRTHMDLLPHCATPAQRATFMQRLLEIHAARPIVTPPTSLTPPAALAAAETVDLDVSKTGGQRDGKKDGLKAAVETARKAAAAAGTKLFTAWAWACGQGAGAQVECLEREAALTRELTKLGRLCDADVAAERSELGAHPETTPLGLGSPVQLAGSPVGVGTPVGSRRESVAYDSTQSHSPPGLRTPSQLRRSSMGGTSQEDGSSGAASPQPSRRVARVQYDEVVSSECVVAVLQLHSTISACLGALMKMPRLARGLSAVALRLTVVRHAVRELPLLRDAIDSMVFGGESVSEYCDSGLLGGTYVLMEAVSEIAMGKQRRVSKDATGSPRSQGGDSPANQRRASRVSKEATDTRVRQTLPARLRTLSQAFALTEALATLHTELLSTRRLSMLHVRQQSAMQLSLKHGIERIMTTGKLIRPGAARRSTHERSAAVPSKAEDGASCRQRHSSLPSTMTAADGRDVRDQRASSEYVDQLGTLAAEQTGTSARVTRGGGGAAGRQQGVRQQGVPPPINVSGVTMAAPPREMVLPPISVPLSTRGRSGGVRVTSAAQMGPPLSYGARYTPSWQQPGGYHAAPTAPSALPSSPGARSKDTFAAPPIDPTAGNDSLEAAANAACRVLALAESVRHTHMRMRMHMHVHMHMHMHMRMHMHMHVHMRVHSVVHMHAVRTRMPCARTLRAHARHAHAHARAPASLLVLAGRPSSRAPLLPPSAPSLRSCPAPSRIRTPRSATLLRGRRAGGSMCSSPPPSPSPRQSSTLPCASSAPRGLPSASSPVTMRAPLTRA